ncbi:MAG: hypothetical protein AB1730_01145 [Myxococcota bacterium]
MRHSVWPATLAVVLVGACGSPTPPPPPPPPPPQVFLTVAEPTVIGGEIKGRVNVSGCTDVTQVQILQAGTFLADANYTKSPTDFTLPASLFSNLYSKLGIAASLTLTARVVCADGRTNTSQPVGVRFFPVASKLSLGGTQVLPDAFVAEGGLGGSPTTFLGCVGTNIGTALGRVNTNGEIIAYNDSIPYACSYDTEISERSPVTGTRWVMQPNVGAYAVDSGLNVTAFVEGKFQRMGVARDGSGIFWSDITGSNTTPVAAKLNPMGGANPVQWVKPAAGFINSTPVVNEGDQTVILSTWQFDIGTRVGKIVVFKYNFFTGDLVNGVGNPQGPPVVFQQNFPELNQPITPYAALNRDGRIIVLPLLSVDVSGTVRTTILACSTSPMGSQCTGTDRRWTGRTFDGVVNLIVPFSAGNYYAAVGPYQAWFLDAQTGAVKNLGEQPLRPSGSLQVLGVQPGLGTEFYLLNGPASETGGTYPMEIVATDKPEDGELWRFDRGSGESPVAGVYLAVDDAAQAWLRVGPDQVKPLTNQEYRAARGPTPIP